ncbi:MAG TPA: type II secretion system F family protein [bacterium]|nr:type II secretion system F family protein [bacterium]HOL93968.1 type II secretion system F family protein [bacterium]HPO99196.1 type II secretion system F family protein [bacterium]HXK92481.1 type II secretion system F family protein [bacterium]
MDPLVIGGFSFFAVFFLVVGVASVTGVVKHPIDRRIDRLRPLEAASATAMSPFYAEQIDQSVVASLGQRVAPKDPQVRSLTKQRLAMAGYYSENALYQYWGAKLMLTMLFPLLLLAVYVFRQMPMTQALFPALFMMGIGFFAPDIFLILRKRHRQEQIFRGLPDALDLLVVCIESGLGLNAALQKVSEEFHMGNRVLSDELKLTCAVIRLGQPRQEAMHDLGERTGVMDLKALVAVLVQAEKFGTSIGQALRVHADDMRTRRRQRAEELAAKTTVKLIFPLVLFIFPAIFVVLGGPAVIKILEHFSK